MLPIQPLKSSGYTFIELLVVIAIMGVIMMMAVPAYGRFQKRQLIEQGAKQFITILRMAQKKASAGEKPSSGCSILDGYRVTGVKNSNTYTMQAVCGGSLHAGSAQTYTMDPRVVFNHASDVTVNFFVVNMGIVRGATVSPINGVILLKFGTDYTYTVTVTPGSGLIKEGAVVDL